MEEGTKEKTASDLLELTTSSLFEGLGDAGSPQKWQQRDEKSLHIDYPEGTVNLSFHKGGFVRLEIDGNIGPSIPPAPRRSDKSWAIEEVPEPLPFKREEDESLIRISCETGSVEIDRRGGTLRFFDREGKGYLEQSGSPFAHSRNLLSTSFKSDERDRFLGLGEKSGNLDRRGRTYEMWNSDEPRHTPERDPLYVSIPLLYRVATKPRTIEADAAGTIESCRVSALFLDEPGRSFFDLADRRKDRFSIALPLSRMVLWIWHADTVNQAQAKWIGMSGRPPMPPLWSLGYHQSRYSYLSSEAVLEIARQFRRRKIPCDVIHLDIDYMDRYRVFTWNRKTFPSPEKLSKELAKEGFRIVTIIDPGVGIDDGSEEDSYPVYRQGEEKGYFLKNPDGKSYIGAVWPGKAAFPDFTRGDVRRWWAELAAEHLKRGVAGIWNDMNEPADFTGNKWIRKEFTPPDSIVSIPAASAAEEGMESEATATAASAPLTGGRETESPGPTPFRELHNIYGQGMCMATRDGSQAARPDHRPFVLSRAGYAGIQRYAALWTGDNNSWWEHMAMSIPMLLGLGISGVPFVGADAGGFQSNADGELFARWISYAAFTPFFRGHSACETRPHEPWAFGVEVEGAAKKAINLRYRLLPYTYALFYEASLSGAPVMRPLFWEFPRDPESAKAADQYLYGPDILVAPVTVPGRRARAVLLPPGQWEDFHTGRRFPGGQYILADAPLERLPLFIRVGAIIPFTGVEQHTTNAWWEKLELQIYLPEPEEQEEPEKLEVPEYRGTLILPADDGISVAGEKKDHNNENGGALGLSGADQLIYSCTFEKGEGGTDLVVSVKGRPGFIPGPESGFQRDSKETTEGRLTRRIDVVVHRGEGKRKQKELLLNYDVTKGSGKTQLHLPFTGV